MVLMLIIVGLFSCLIGLLDRERREDRDIIFFDFNILLFDIDNRLELLEDIVLLLGILREVFLLFMFCRFGLSRCLVFVFFICIRSLFFLFIFVEWCGDACFVVWVVFFLSEFWEEWLFLCLSEFEEECGLECLVEFVVEWEFLCLRDFCEAWDLFVWWG